MIQAQELVSETSKLLDQKVLVVGVFDACFSQGHKTKTAAFVAGATYIGTKLAKKKLGPLAWVAGTIGGNKLEAFLARRNLQGKNLTPIVVCAVTESRHVYLIEWDGNHRSGTLGKILHEFHLSDNTTTDNIVVRRNGDDHDDDVTPDGPSLSLFAACTYSRVFGLDYLDDCCHESRSDEDEDDEVTYYSDWCIVPTAPIRSTVPYGDFDTLEVRSTGNNNNVEETSVGHCSASDNGMGATTSCSNKHWIWLNILIMGLLLLFVLAFVVFYFAMETIQTSRRYY